VSPDLCVTPGTTPTDGEVPITGVIGLFRRLVRTDQPESTKRAVALLASCTLCFCEVVLILAIWYQAVLIGKVDPNLNYALGIISASVAGLAGVTYRKPEDPQ
jgi:hypothetical protein